MKKDSFDKAFGDFMGERLTQAFRESLSSNKQYKQCQDKIDRLHNKLESIIPVHLQEEFFEIYDEIEETSAIKHNIEDEQYYKQGLKDGEVLRRILGQSA